MSIDVGSEGLRLLLELLRTAFSVWAAFRPLQQPPRSQKKQRRLRRRNELARPKR